MANNMAERINTSQILPQNNQNGDGRSERTVDGLITNAIESISRLREMRPAINNAQQTQPSPTMASEIVRLFPTFQHAASPATNANRNQVQNLDRQRVSNNKRRHTKVLPSRSKIPKKKKLVHKDIVFIFNPSVDKVPTHQTRLRLEKKGRIIHDFPFDRDWVEWQMCSAIEQEMPMLANGEYEFLKASYGSLIRPKLSSNCTLTCDALMRITGQGSVYVRTLQQLSDEESDEEIVEECEVRMPTPATLTPDTSQTSSSTNELSGMEILVQKTNMRDALQENPFDEVDELPDQIFEHESEEERPDGNSTVSTEDLPSIETPGSPSIYEIIIPRSDILKSMISEFSKPSVLQCCLIFGIKGDNGVTEMGRGAGVTRELLSLFWREFSVVVATGSAEKVPVIRHDFQKLEWQSVARILLFGFKQENYFPLFISKAFIGCCLFGEEAVNKECLLESFSFYISKDEQETMKKCLKGELDPIKDDVMDLLSSYKCYRRPTKESIQVIFEELAHQELIQKPKYVSNTWSSELQSLKQHPEFHDIHSMSPCRLCML
ncbi:uncharacterized protein LOC114517709 [Dendronephthya gigantea]|uniref:uncharacterized protein LOC114517709 n=1 Tax=Dendronephthya gigantea TaxID=151771 RepID=UPI00106B93C1|nr:uncharacterized protein LOC114517709 [Dendronephthya gigantea]